MKQKYELTEEMVMQADTKYRCARITHGYDKNGYDIEVGYVRLPNEIFNLVREFIEGLD